MKFTVTWNESARDELLEIWLAASSRDRARVTAASNSIDNFLQYRPESLGESRTGTIRLLFVEPLVVTYDVNIGDCLVTILAVHRPPERDN